MLSHRVQQVSRQDKFRFRNAPCGCGHNRVVARDVRVDDVEGLFFQNRSQPKRGEEIQRVQERELDLRTQGTVTSSRDRYVMTSLPERFDELENVSFAASEIARRTNLQNAH